MEVVKSSFPVNFQIRLLFFLVLYNKPRYISCSRLLLLLCNLITSYFNPIEQLTLMHFWFHNNISHHFCYYRFCSDFLEIYFDWSRKVDCKSDIEMPLVPVHWSFENGTVTYMSDELSSALFWTFFNDFPFHTTSIC